MAKLLFAISCFSVLHYQVLSQFPSPFIVDSPYSQVLPVSQTLPPSTTIITDCTPETCKNLANTLQLMIVANLLQNTNGGSDLALQMAGPLMNELFTSPTLSCGCRNPFASQILSPSLVSPSVFSPSIISPNVVSPSIYSNAVSPNLVSSLVSALGASGPGLLSYF